MKKKTIKEYMNIANKISNKIFFKVHEFTHVPFSFDRLSVHSNEDYSININWKLIYKKKSLFPSNDFDNSYEIR